jgi:hypothetical protein
MKRPQKLALILPAPDQADASDIQPALIELGRKLLAEGYAPSSISRAMIATGVCLALDFGGHDAARKDLEYFMGRVADDQQGDVSPTWRH